MILGLLVRVWWKHDHSCSQISTLDHAGLVKHAGYTRIDPHSKVCYLPDCSKTGKCQSLYFVRSQHYTPEQFSNFCHAVSGFCETDCQVKKTQPVGILDLQTSAGGSKCKSEAIKTNAYNSKAGYNALSADAKVELVGKRLERVHEPATQNNWTTKDTKLKDLKPKVIKNLKTVEQRVGKKLQSKAWRSVDTSTINKYVTGDFFMFPKPFSFHRTQPVVLSSLTCRRRWRIYLCFWWTIFHRVVATLFLTWKPTVEKFEKLSHVIRTSEGHGNTLWNNTICKGTAKVRIAFITWSSKNE